MRYKGKSLTGPREEILVFPRQDGDVVFKAKAVLDFEEFDSVFPRPEPPSKMMPGGKTSTDFNDPSYREEVSKRDIARVTWMILKSLQATDELEWETVNMTDPETWKNFEDELRDSGFNRMEVQKITRLALDVNSVDEKKMEEARERFLADQRAAKV